MLSINGKIDGVAAKGSNDLRYRLYFSTNLEPHKQDEVAVYLAQSFDGASVSSGLGIWKGTSEHSSVIEVITDKNNAPVIESLFTVLATVIKRSFHQEAVLLTCEPIISILL